MVVKNVYFYLRLSISCITFDISNKINQLKNRNYDKIKNFTKSLRQIT